MTEDELRDWFAYREGTPEQVKACVAVRTAMYRAAEAFRAATNSGPGQYHALTAAKDALRAMVGEIVSPAPQ